MKSVAELISQSYRRRVFKSWIMTILLFIACAAAIAPLLSVFWYVILKGHAALNGSFFSQLPKPVGEIGGGVANAILGSATLVALSSAIGVPWGIATGMYLSEYGLSRAASLIRFSVEMLASVPSIVVGLFVYAAVVIPMGHFSTIAGSVALSILMVPTVARTTEEILKLVPTHIREAGLALGLPRWKVTLWIVLRGSLGAITTGVMLAVARASGETAPLLFTAFGNQFWQRGLTQPIASLPVQIYTYAISPYDDWHRQAWASALLLVLLVLILNLGTRLVLARTIRQGRSH